MYSVISVYYLLSNDIQPDPEKLGEEGGYKIEAWISLGGRNRIDSEGELAGGEEGSWEDQEGDIEGVNMRSISWSLRIFEGVCGNNAVYSSWNL